MLGNRAGEEVVIMNVFSVRQDLELLRRQTFGSTLGIFLDWVH